MSERRLFAGALLFLCVAGIAAAADRPVAVSPGDAANLALIEDRCPTFSWGSVKQATTYEIVVYRVGEGREGARPILHRTLPGSALSWTPSLELCLERGGRYAWSLRAQTKQGFSEWSPPNLFAVAARPSDAELETALEIVESYLASKQEVSESGPITPEDNVTEGLQRRPPSVASGTAAAAAATQLSVEGNIEAISFTGDGENLDNVTTDAELGSHSADASAHHVRYTDGDAVSAVGPHIPDTTCLDEGVVCSFAGSSSEGGAAAVAESGDSATGFFAVGQIEEPRIADEIARDAEVLGFIAEAIAAEAACPGAGGSTDRYTDCGNGTVHDNSTGLLWLKDASCGDLPDTGGVGYGNYSYTQAAVAALSDGMCGLTDGSSPGDWRLPEWWEFCSYGFFGVCPEENSSNSLINSAVGPPTVANTVGDGAWAEGDPFLGVQSYWYWSRTLFFSNRVSANLSTGETETASEIAILYIWPVRERD